MGKKKQHVLSLLEEMKFQDGYFDSTIEELDLDSFSDDLEIYEGDYHEEE